MEIYLEKFVLIVESDSRQRKRIADRVYAAAGELSIKVKIYNAVNAVRAAKILEQKDIDLLILNTVYQGMSVEELPGIHLVESLRKVEKYIPLPVIFVSSKMEQREYAFTELNSIGYQSFVFDEKMLEKNIRKGFCHTTERDREKQILLKSETMLYPVCIKDIIYIEKENKGVRFLLQDGSILMVSYRTLSDVKEKIKSRNLLQCGRNTIINTEYIEKIEDNVIFLFAGNKTIKKNVGTRYRSAVKSITFNFCESVWSV